MSRMHRVVDGEPLPGVISVLGGKITGYRAIAEDVTDAVCRSRRSTPVHDRGRAATRGARESATSRRIAGRRGRRPFCARCTAAARERSSRSPTRTDLNRPLSPRYPDIAAQVIFGVRFEHCVRLSDFIRRRTLLGASTDQGWDAALAVAALMAAELGWSPGRCPRKSMPTAATSTPRVVQGGAMTPGSRASLDRGVDRVSCSRDGGSRSAARSCSWLPCSVRSRYLPNSPFGGTVQEQPG